jgi:hypothetical protein
MKKKKLALEVINPHAAGIDVGSRSHFVAIGQRDEDVREFGVYAEDLKEVTAWLLENGVTTVAMESTGTYWQNLFTSLQTGGLQVRIAFRKGRTSAVSATARKLAVIIWNMITKGVQYAAPTPYEFLDQKRKRKVQEMKKLIHKFDITPTDLGLQLNINNLR